MSYGERIFAEDIPLDSTRNSKTDGSGNDLSNSDPTSLGLDDDGNLLVADYAKSKLFFYQLVASNTVDYGDAVAANDWSLTGIANPTALVSDGTHTLVHDDKADDFNAFLNTDKSAVSGKNITKAKLAQGSYEGYGMFGFTIDDATTRTIFGVDSLNQYLRAFTFAGDRVPASERDLKLIFNDADVVLRYISYNGGVLFFTDAANQRVVAMEAATGRRMPQLEWPLIDGHQVSRDNIYDGGLLVTATRAYIVDADNDKVVVYDRENHTQYGRKSVTV